MFLNLFQRDSKGDFGATWGKNTKLRREACKVNVLHVCSLKRKTPKQHSKLQSWMEFCWDRANVSPVAIWYTVNDCMRMTFLNPFKLCRCWRQNPEALAQTQKVRLELVVTKSIALKCDGVFGWTSKRFYWKSLTTGSGPPPLQCKKSQMAKRNRNGAALLPIRQTLSTYLVFSHFYIII